MSLPSRFIRTSRSSPPNNKERAVPSPLSAMSSSPYSPSSSSTSTSTYHRWIIGTKLPALPADYSLVRTHLYVDLDDNQDSSNSKSNPQPAQQLANRICLTLKALSITVTDDNDNDDDYDSNRTTVFADEKSGEEEVSLLLLCVCDILFHLLFFHFLPHSVSVSLDSLSFFIYIECALCRNTT